MLFNVAADVDGRVEQIRTDIVDAEAADPVDRLYFDLGILHRLGSVMLREPTRQDVARLVRGALGLGRLQAAVDQHVRLLTEEVRILPGLVRRIADDRRDPDESEYAVDCACSLWDNMLRTAYSEAATAALAGAGLSTAELLSVNRAYREAAARDAREVFAWLRKTCNYIDNTVAMTYPEGAEIPEFLTL